MSDAGHPWSDFLHHRARAIDWLWSGQGDPTCRGNDARIAEVLSMNPTQVTLIRSRERLALGGVETSAVKSMDDDLQLRSQVSHQVDTLLQRLLGERCGFVLIYSPGNGAPQPITFITNLDVPDALDCMVQAGTRLMDGAGVVIERTQAQEGES